MKNVTENVFHTKPFTNQIMEIFYICCYSQKPPDHIELMKVRNDLKKLLFISCLERNCRGDKIPKRGSCSSL